MLRVVWAMALMMSASLVGAMEKGAPIPDYAAKEVTGGVYVIHGPMGYPNPENRGFMNNPGFIVTANGVVVVDPGSSVQTGEMVLRQIRKVTDKPLVAVLNTHVHGDHWLGNQALRQANPEVPIYGHPNMIAGIEKGAGLQWVDLMLRSTDGATAGTKVVGPNLAIEDGDVLELDGLTVEVHYAGTAHSSSDVMFHLPQHGTVFLGDNVCNERIVRMDDGAFTGNIAAIERAKAIDAEVWVPGHGQTAGAEVLDAYQSYLSELYSAVEEFYDEGLSDFEMKPQVSERLSDYHDWIGFEDELGKHISLAYLEVERKMFE